MRQNILGLNSEELKKILQTWQEKPFHAQQIFSWIYKKGILDFSRMSDLPEELREKLSKHFSTPGLKLFKTIKSVDGTEKFLFELKDKELIEAVVIPSENRTTVCISTQVGCKFACRFCASGLSGFKRDLTTAEIIEEIFRLKNNSQAGNITHIVFMGTGEPLDNYDNLLKAIRIINAPWGFTIGARRITISTCGIIPGIKRLSQEGLQIELSISLHAANDKLRSQLVPVNKKYPLNDLMACCREYFKKTNRQVTFEYVLIRGINSGLPNAQELVKILQGLDYKVNLIIGNPVKELNIEPPGKLEVLLFRDYLLKHKVKVTLRKPRGEDIEAACGQLRLRYEKKA